MVKCKREVSSWPGGPLTMTPPAPRTWVGGANHVDPLLGKGHRGSVWSSDWPVTPWGPAAWGGADCRSLRHS